MLNAAKLPLSLFSVKLSSHFSVCFCPLVCIMQNIYVFYLGETGVMKREEGRLRREKEEERTKGKGPILSLPLTSPILREIKPETGGRIQERSGASLLRSGALSRVQDQQGCFPAQGTRCGAVGAILSAPVRRQERLTSRNSGNIWELE